MNNEKPKNPLAFPHEHEDEGMTLLDYFAAKAMQSILIKCEPGRFTNDQSLLAKWAYEDALSMLKDRGKYL